MPVTDRPPFLHADLYDAQSNYAVANALTGFGGRGPRWEALLAAGTAARRDLPTGPVPMAERVLVVSATDPNSDAQSGWKRMLAGLNDRVELIDLDYRDTSVTLPPVRPDDDRPYRPVFSTGPILAYQIGVMAANKGATLLVATHDFSVALPAVDFVRRSGGTFILMGFRSHLDRRFEMGGFVLRPDSPLKFHNLETHAPAILGTAVAPPLMGTARSPAKLLFPTT